MIFLTVPNILDQTIHIKKKYILYALVCLQIYLGGVGTSQMETFLDAGNTKGGSITVPMTSCLTGLESAV
jgi:hypothetical protein